MPEFNFVKKLLKSRGEPLALNNYKQDVHEQEMWFASSDYLELKANKLKNNIAFYVSGNEYKCNELKLILNINDISSEVPAKEFLIACAKDICDKVTNNLPLEVESYIRLTGRCCDKFSKCYSEIIIDINFIPFKNSDIDGYEIQFIIKLS